MILKRVTFGKLNLEMLLHLKTMPLLLFSQPKEITILSAYHCRIQQYAHTVCRALLWLIVGQAEVSQ